VLPVLLRFIKKNSVVKLVLWMLKYITDFPKLAEKLSVIRTDRHENLVRPKNILPVRKKSPQKFTDICSSGIDFAYGSTNCLLIRFWNRHRFLVGSCYSIFSFMCMICRSLFVHLYFLFWSSCCLFFFDLRISKS
jgi:hypothetical protein